MDDSRRNGSITARGDRALLKAVELRCGKDAADALAVAMIPTVESEVDELIAQRNSVASLDPRLN